MPRLLAAFAVGLLAAGFCFGGTYCVPNSGDITVGGTAGGQSYRPQNTLNFVVTTGYTVALADSYCTSGDPNNRTYVAIALGYAPCTALALPTEGSSDCAWYDFTVAANPNASPFSGTSIGNSLDFGAQPYWVSVKAAYGGEDPNFAPWVSTQFWSAMGADPPPPVAPAIDSNTGTSIAAVSSEADAEVFYVNTSTGDDVLNSCTAAKDPNTPKATWCGVLGGLSCIDGRGDTVVVADGTYTEATCAIPNFSGDRRWPIVVKAANRGAATLASTSGSIMTIAGSRAFWTFDGFALFCNSCGATSIAVTSTGAGLTWRYITDNDSTQANQIVLSITQSGQTAPGDHLIENWTLDGGYSGDVFDFTNYRGPITIRASTFDNGGASAGHLVHAHNQGGGLIIEGNLFKNFAGLSEGALFMYLGSEGSIVRDNVFDTMPIGIQTERSGRISILNNTFRAISDRAVNIGKRSNFMDIRNNIFMGNGTTPFGVRFNASGASTFQATEYGSTLTNNTFCGFADNLRHSSLSNGPEILADSLNCYGPESATCGTVATQSNCHCAPDPNAAYAIDPNGPCDDAGDASEPVPTGGGSVRDIGAREVGASAPPYTSYAQFWSVADTTPRFNWTFLDPQNRLNVICPLLMFDTDAQANYRVQIDASPLFNSLNDGNANGPGYPLWDSGTVASASAYHVTHADNALTGGQCYHWRVRTTDDVLTGRWSNWSDGLRKVCVP